jgi:hypothetical protein
LNSVPGAREALYHLSHTTSLFALVIFSRGSHKFAQLAWIAVLLLMPPT